MSSVALRLLGSWRMIEWRLQTLAGWIDPPLGSSESCRGQLMYCASGAMSVTLSAGFREPFTEDFLGAGTPAEKVGAYDSIICYAGTYVVDEELARVTHRIEYATFPNMIQTELHRICVFDGDTLRLDTPPMRFGGQELASFIKWRRFNNDPAGRSAGPE